MNRIALGIMAAHSLAHWYDACENQGTKGRWLVRHSCPIRRLATKAVGSLGYPRSAVVEAHRRCALAIVLAWRDRQVSHA